MKKILIAILALGLILILPSFATAQEPVLEEPEITLPPESPPPAQHGMHRGKMGMMDMKKRRAEMRRRYLEGIRREDTER